MLASRGPVYYSEKTAMMNSEHAGCRCEPMASDELSQLEGYSEEEYAHRWAVVQDLNEALSTPEWEGYLDAMSVSRRDMVDGYALERRKTELLDEYDNLGKKRKQLDRKAADYLKKDAELYDRMLAIFDEEQQVQGALDKLYGKQSEIIRRRIAGIRELGKEPGKRATDYLQFQTRSRSLTAAVDDALEYIPRDWLIKMKQAGIKIDIEPRLNRSRYLIQSKTLRLVGGADKYSVIHELMHVMEDIDKDFFDDSLAYFVGRTQGRRPKRLNALVKGANYGRTELAFDMGGKCIHPYAYKKYESSPANYYAFEVTSMGMEYLYERPWTFIKDPKLLKFILHKIKEL